MEGWFPFFGFPVNRFCNIFFVIQHSENITSQRSSASQSQPDMVSLFCLSDDDHYVTQFQRNDKFVVIYRNSPREITILVRNFPDDHLLIWYDNDFLHEINTIDFIRCIVSTDNHTQKIIVSDDLEQDKIYIFCLVHKDTMLIFPLNCVAYQQLKKPDTINQCRTEVMPQDAKMKLIFGLIAVYLICVFIGAFLICAIHGKLVELCKGKAKCSNNNGQNEAFGGAASGTE